jgi:hypothetical protein
VHLGSYFVLPRSIRFQIAQGTFSLPHRGQRKQSTFGNQ